MYKIQKIKVIKYDPFKDFRGKYLETFNKNFYKKHKLKNKFIQDDFSYSKKNVLRGFHGDNKTWKIFTCIYGKVQFAFINNIKNSKKFGEIVSFIVDENSHKGFIIPPNFGSAHLVLSERSIIHYKQSTLYGETKQFTVSYKTKYKNFRWMSKQPILSKRDKY